MPEQRRYRGRAVTAEDIVFIRALIAQHPDLSRRRLSAKLCELWQWKQANGALRDMVCRGLLLLLHRAGEIQLPATRCGLSRDWAEYERPEPLVPDNRPVRGPLRELLSLEFQQVRRTEQEPLFDSLIEQ